MVLIVKNAKKLFLLIFCKSTSYVFQAIKKVSLLKMSCLTRKRLQLCNLAVHVIGAVQHFRKGNIG